MLKFFLICIVIAIIYVIWQRWELKQFKVTDYTVRSEKIATPLKLMVVADFHGHYYGKNNQRLVKAAREMKPDMILIPGDMIVSGHLETYPAALGFFEELTKIAPVYFANGNHESRVELPESAYYKAYQDYKKQVEALGVHILNNASEASIIRGNQMEIYGADIPLECYTKGSVVPLPPNCLSDTLGEIQKGKFSVLLAHNPLFSEDYAKWGADLIVSGHYHGGLIRIPGVGSLLSPQFQFFPKYDGGHFEIGRSHVVVSRGLGTHTFHIRVFNRAELIAIHLRPNTSSCV